MGYSEENARLFNLIKKARFGCQESMNRLALCVQNDLFVYIYRLTLNYEVAEDLKQETLLEMVKSLKDLKHLNRFRPWLFRTASSKVQHYFRNKQRGKSVKSISMIDAEKATHLVSEYDGGGLKKIVDKELSQAVLRAMAALKLSHRNILNLRCFEELSYSEIAEVMNCSEKAAHVLFFRAKLSLKRKLAKHGFNRNYLLGALGLFACMTSTSEAAPVVVSAAIVEVSTSTAVFGFASTKMGITAMCMAAALIVTGSVILPNNRNGGISSNHISDSNDLNSSRAITHVAHNNDVISSHIITHVADNNDLIAIPEKEDRLGNIPLGDIMHQRGWTYFRVSGRVNGQRVHGRGRIPFIFNELSEHSPWLELTIDDNLVIVDGTLQAYLADGSGKIIVSCPAGSFMKGLSRPWMGMHTIDTIRRDATEKRIRFSTKQNWGNINGSSWGQAEITLFCDTADKESQIVYTVDMEKDVIETIAFKNGNQEDVLQFTYLQEIDPESEEFTEPAKVNIQNTKHLDSMGILWLIELTQGTFGILDTNKFE